MKKINTLTIGATDPSSGAGIQADLKTFSALGVYGCSIITALVAQNTCGVQAIYYIDPNFIVKQLDSVFNDIQINSIKIGMLANTDITEIVAEQLQHRCAKNITVLDTVMLSKSGDRLLSPAAVSTLRKKLLPQVNIITPNLLEAAELLETSPACNEQEMKKQGQELLTFVKEAVLLKGGHLNNSIESPDWLFTCKNMQRFTSPRIKTKNTHGTGCAISAAIAALRPQHDSWSKTVQEAKNWLNVALLNSDKLEIGNGNGPIHHFHEWW